jgi:hypothetical protein
MGFRVPAANLGLGFSVFPHAQPERALRFRGMDTKTHSSSWEDELCRTVDASHTEKNQKRPRWRGALQAAPALRFGLLAAGAACAGCALAVLAGRALKRRRERRPAGSSGSDSGVTGVEGWKADLWRPLRARRHGFFGGNRPRPESAGRPF